MISCPAWRSACAISASGKAWTQIAACGEKKSSFIALDQVPVQRRAFAHVALYFAADHEPVLWVVVATAIALMLGAVLLRRSRLFASALLIAAVAAGFAMAT